MYLFSILSSISTGKIIQEVASHTFNQLSTDSRNSISTVHVLFFAISGQNHNGHNYIQQLYERGVRQFVVEQETDTSQLGEASLFLVKSTIKTLQDVAAHHRNNFQLGTIGITGSNGKTIVKEWLYQLLSPDHYVVKSPKSYNSQIGVPLSVWQINEKHKTGIFEAGISKAGEMENLQKVIQPDIGIFTNIGPAHDTGFASLSDKVKEKLFLFSDVDRLIFCRDQALINDLVAQTNIPAFTWGYHADADLVIDKKTTLPHGTALSIKSKKKDFTAILPLTDRASIENAMHCIALLVLKGYEEWEINKKIQGLRAVPMRLELKGGINGCKIIDDTYNNDLAGIQIALEFMQQQGAAFPKTVIISDILQSEEEEQVYSELNKLLLLHDVKKLVGIGTNISRYPSLFTVSASFYMSADQYLELGGWPTIKDEMILVKGARPFSMEKIVKVLQQKIHGTVLEINLNALTRNLNFYTSKLAGGTKIMAMVKALAYGSGSYEIANLLQHHQVDYLGVAYADEGVALRKQGIHMPIMVMNPSPDSFNTLINHHLEPEIYNFKILNHLLHFIGDSSVSIHIKIDTGMHRLGFETQDIDALITLLKENSKHLNVKSIFTHLAGTDDETHDEFSELQVAKFTKIADLIKEQLGVTPLIHVLNSAGILRFPKFQFDMVRLGIGLYGIDASQHYQDRLEPISTLKTTISQIKKVEKGESVGYGRKGVADKDMMLATIAVGYADGFLRIFGNGTGKVIVKGSLVPVVGQVCMDMTMIDVTDINVNEGDEVEIFGKNRSITEVAKQAETIPYEILTNVSSRVKRIFYID